MGARRGCPAVSEFPCPQCGAPLSVATLLSSVAGYNRRTRSATAPCRSCGKDLEFQVRGGLLVLGYTYWAGSLHFEGLIDVPARGLRLVEEGAEVCFGFGGVLYRVPRASGGR